GTEYRKKAEMCAALGLESAGLQGLSTSAGAGTARFRCRYRVLLGQRRYGARPASGSTTRRRRPRRRGSPPCGHRARAYGPSRARQSPRTPDENPARRSGASARTAEPMLPVVPPSGGVHLATTSSHPLFHRHFRRRPHDPRRSLQDGSPPTVAGAQRPETAGPIASIDLRLSSRQIPLRAALAIFLLVVFPVRRNVVVGMDLRGPVGVGHARPVILVEAFGVLQ